MVRVIMCNLSGIWHASIPVVRNTFKHLLQDHLALILLYRHGKTEKIKEL